MTKVLRDVGLAVVALTMLVGVIAFWVFVVKSVYGVLFD